MLTLIAVGIVVLIAELALPYFNLLAEKSMSLSYNWSTLAALLALAIFLGLVAGIYPALVISGFSPILALRCYISKMGSNKHLLLRSLVIFQFVLSVFLITCTFIMQRQLNYLQNKNLGFDKEHLITFPHGVAPSGDMTFSMIYEDAMQKGELLKNELAANSDVKALTISSHVFGTVGWMQMGYTDPVSQKYKNFNMLVADHEFIPTMDIKLKAGRNFSEEVGTDAKTAVIMNEVMASQYNMLDKIGEQLPKPFEAFQLIGIAEDFNFNTLHNPIEPLLIAMDPIEVRRVVSDVGYLDTPFPKYSLKIASGDMMGTVKTVEEAWKKVAPGQSFDFSFIDQNLESQYRTERRLSNIMLVATLLAVFIACLGLFGIATLSITRRTKEIGVRKILGATTGNILLLLNKRFTWMVLTANLIAAPVAYYFMNNWLKDFAYQTSISVGIFLLAALITIAIAWLAVSYQSLRAAVANPVNSLRYE